MKTSVINLKPPYEEFGLNAGGPEPKLSCIIHDTQPERSFPAVICVPGGSYMRCSKREGEPSAARWYSYGYNTFVLEYSCIGKPFPTALCELAQAVKYVRENAEELCCDGKILICGFSAGGHLAASLGAYWDKSLIRDVFGDKVRPDGLVLCYPVITAGEYSHKLSIDSIAPDESIREAVSLEKHITGTMPPCFVWHCSDDKTVPVENSLMLCSALSKENIPFEMHIFPEGGHGIAMCDITTLKDNNSRYINPVAAQWFMLAKDWADRLLYASRQQANRKN